jgi:hypothetical protein
MREGVKFLYFIPKGHGVLGPKQEEARCLFSQGVETRPNTKDHETVLRERE